MFFRWLYCAVRGGDFTTIARLAQAVLLRLKGGRIIPHLNTRCQGLKPSVSHVLSCPPFSPQGKALAAVATHGAGLVSVAAVNGPDSLTLAGPRRLVELVAAAALSPSAGPSSSSNVTEASCDGSLESLEEGSNGNIGGGEVSAGDGSAPVAGATTGGLSSKAIDLPPDRFRILQGVSRAFHSPAMALAAIGTQEAARKVSLRDPAIPLASNVTGRLAKAGELTDPAYWSKV